MAFEPIKYLFEKGLYNIHLNEKLVNKIQFIQKAVSCKNGKTKIYFEEDLDNDSGGSSQYSKDKPCSELVVTITIDKILKEYDIDPYILKMDCEGFEVDIILNSDLSMFKEVWFEYHTPMTKVDPEVLIRKLEKQNFEMIEKNAFILNSGYGIIKMINKDFDII